MNIPPLWQTEIDAGTEFGKRILKGLATPITKRPVKPVKPDVSSIGHQIRSEWESKLGYTITCGTCLAFLSSLNKAVAFHHSSLSDELYTMLPFSDTMRATYKIPQRKELIREIVNRIVPELKVDLTKIVNYKISQPNNSDWATVVTTAPRKEATLEACLYSIIVAGWCPTVFAEPDSIQLSGYKYFNNDVRLGAWFNWLKSVRWALEKTTAKYILSVQDDSLFHPDSRCFIEQIMWPTNRVGFISLYTAKHYSENRSGDLKPVGLNQIETSSLWGACALVFPREALIQIVNHPLVGVWTGVPSRDLSDAEKIELLEQKKNNPYLIQNVDTAIGKIITGLHLEMYVVDPSPVRHISTYSSIGHSDSNAGKRNCGRCADHTKPLMEQVFPV